MSLFQHLALALNTADALTFRIQGAENGKLRLTVIPELKGEAPTEGDGADLRAALALPLVLTDDPARLDAGFTEILREYAAQRASLKQSLAVIDSLQKANAKAASKASKPAATPPEPAKNAADAPKAASAPATATDDDILL
ncbi:MAG: PRTRC system protein E [Gammaproteobacteria bacterium]|nr:MAG: PRTRC system protein E [Gammaproteobacteria bacterium]